MSILDTGTAAMPSGLGPSAKVLVDSGALRHRRAAPGSIRSRDVRAICRTGSDAGGAGARAAAEVVEVRRELQCRPVAIRSRRAPARGSLRSRDDALGTDPRVGEGRCGGGTVAASLVQRPRGQPAFSRTLVEQSTVHPPVRGSLYVAVDPRGIPPALLRAGQRPARVRRRGA